MVIGTLVLVRVSSRSYGPTKYVIFMGSPACGHKWYIKKLIVLSKVHILYMLNQ